MKPIQPHKDPRITNISFDNFTGSICIIIPISDGEEQAENLMLSSAPNHAGVDLFKPNHHLSIITQPVLGARSRKKDKIDSISTSRRSSYNDTSLLTLPITRVEKFHHEKKTNFHESSDSGLDFSLSTNSSIQYSQQQQQPIIHRPLSALNEDSSTDDGFHDQSARLPVINNPGHHYSIESLIHDHHSNEIKKSNDESHFETQSFVPIQQHHSLNDLTNTKHTIPFKPLRKKTKLNIIIEPSISSVSSSHLNINDEQIHSINRIPSSTSSTNQTTSQLIRTRNQLIKPKAITPLDHYPNQEQIRAHINRSVIERQHPPYLPVPPRKGQNVRFDATNVNKLLSRQVKQPTNTYRSNSNIHGGHLTIQNSHTIRSIKPILPDLHHEERRLNETNKWHEKEPIRSKVKDLQKPLKINLKRANQQDHLDNFLTSTPRRHYEPGPNFKGQQSIYPNYKSKPTGFFTQNKTRIINPEFESSSRNPIGSFQSYSNKQLRIPNNIEHQMNTNNILSKINLTQLNKEQKQSNRFFQSRSPISRSIISEHYYEPNRTYRIIPINEQQSLDGRHVISKRPIFVDCASQTSAPYIDPFIHTIDSNNDIDVDISSKKLNGSDNIEHRSCSSSSSLDRFSPHDRLPLPLGKLTVAMEEDAISTNYDSDDGWSDESAELIYADERYLTQMKKKSISSSSSSSSSSSLLSSQQ